MSDRGAAQDECGISLFLLQETPPQRLKTSRSRYQKPWFIYLSQPAPNLVARLVHSATLYIYCKKKTVETNIRSLSEKEERNGQMNETGVAPVISLDSCFHLTSMQVCLIQGNTSNVPGVTGGDTKHKQDFCGSKYGSKEGQKLL